jgi:polyketide biosynthesis enoyl-CoA hydratase PksI
MQGHAIGGGFVLGLFSDLIIFGRESFYSTNFMRFGFTPGMGATHIVTEKLGIGIGEEMMLSAENIRGAEFEKRGIPFPVKARDEVFHYALLQARKLAAKPRGALITLKDHLVSGIRKTLPLVIEKEVRMHDKTFHNPEVRERINTLYGR